jgi:hypothetical protein
MLTRLAPRKPMLMRWVRANVSVAREHLRALCRGRHFAAHGRGREGAEIFCTGHHAES